MVNEIDHVKLGFSELARVNVADQWLQYHFNSVDDVWIVSSPYVPEVCRGSWA